MKQKVAQHEFSFKLKIRTRQAYWDCDRASNPRRQRAVADNVAICLAAYKILQLRKGASESFTIYKRNIL